MAGQSAEQWSEATPPESLTAMRKALEANTAKCQSSLEWAMKTYELVKPTIERIEAVERDSRWAMVAATLAVIGSLICVACELAR